MRVLSLWEPWATLMALRLKKFETRDWAGSRGVTAVHAAKKKFNPADYGPAFIEQLKVDGVDLKALAYGCVVCIVDFTRFYRTEVIRARLDRRELCYGNYADGRKAWESEFIRKFDDPIPLVGHQGFFGWPEGDKYLAGAVVSPASHFGPLFGGAQ
jgi:hypothetical protein